ncbi:DUF2442 domain-containing protein [Pseudomonas japonica]|nr:DUF2442 domain-containing protein [Pseudomonas japonica]
MHAHPGAILDLTFTSGQRFSLDMGHDVKTYPGLEPLAKPEAFEKAILGDAGWTVEWPELDIQIGTDTLFLEALAQAVPDRTPTSLNPITLRHWSRLQSPLGTDGLNTTRAA